MKFLARLRGKTRSKLFRYGWKITLVGLIAAGGLALLLFYGAWAASFDMKKVGAMIEIPSAAISADALAREVDFFSIGTNDLIQYTIAVDRVNERIAHLYEPTHPAVLRLLKMIADAAHANKIWVGVCGEMARDVATIPILIGLGMDELSVGATSVPRVKMAVRSLAVPECQELVDEVLRLQTSSEILGRCMDLATKRYSDLLG